MTFTQNTFLLLPLASPTRLKGRQLGSTWVGTRDVEVAFDVSFMDDATQRRWLALPVDLFDRSFVDVALIMHESAAGSICAPARD